MNSEQRTIMQNKPNLPDAQMNITSVITKYYENKSNWKLGENKPNQTQFLKILDNLSIIISAPFLTGVDKSCQIMDNETGIVHSPEAGRETDAFACKTK